MQRHDSITATIRSIRKTALENGEYISSELRTKQVMTDPILRALGWDTSNPSEVQMEARLPQTASIPDYALFKNNPKTPVGILEAKTLNPVVVPRLKDRIQQHEHRVLEAFRNLRFGRFDEDQTNRNTLFDQETWAGLKEAHEAQLEKYVREIGMTAGYGILTNGDDWWIYDIQEYSGSKEGLRRALVRETSILFEENSKAARDLEIIRRDSNWGGTTLQWSEFLRENEP